MMTVVNEHIIALVDCDCFFVSCERVDNPKLNGKPVCVTTAASRRGIVEFCSNEVKTLKIKMRTHTFQRKRKYSNAYYIPAIHQIWRNF